MKYIVLIMGLLVVGCGTITQKDVLHIYERGGKRNPLGGIKLKDWSSRMALRDNGIVDFYSDGRKVDFNELSRSMNTTVYLSWSIVDKELHVISNPFNGVDVYIINPDGSITKIADISDGERREISKEKQLTWKKIK